MNVLIKYLSLEAIENTITCLNYNIDKVVFFGRKAVIEEESDNISSFLLKYLNCGSEYIAINSRSSTDIEEQLKQIVNEDCYFDFTGDEGIFEGVAFKVANDLDVPVHTYDVWNKRTIVIKKNKNGNCISDIKKEKSKKLTIKSYIEMIGGYVICNDNHKGDVNPYLIKLRKKLGREKWTAFCNLLAYCKTINENYFECNDVTTLIKGKHYQISKDETLLLIKELNKNEIIEIVDINENSFKFESEKNAWVFAKAGNMLEQIVYLNKKDKYDDCAVGVFFSWDEDKQDVKNEIDVVCIKDYQLTFISCKDRILEREDMYELETVARGFVGNYINMEIATTDKPSFNLINRGKELGIKIDYLNWQMGD